MERKGGDISEDVMKKLAFLEERERTAEFLMLQSEEHPYSEAFENRLKKRFSEPGQSKARRRNRLWKAAACAGILVLATTVSVVAGGIARRDPVAAADESVLFAFIPEDEDIEPEPLTEGTCPRCGKGTIEAVCSHETVERDGSVEVYEDCDDPTHPEGCRKIVTYCYTNYAHIGCPAEYFHSGTETHAEFVEHTLAESGRENVCRLPVCIPKWMEDSRP